MRIAILAQTFSPEIGGVATISRTMAELWASQGHVVEVFTRTLASSNTAFPFRVHRGLTPRAGARLIRDCDLILQNHISLWGMAVHLMTRRPCLIWLQAPIDECAPDLRSRLTIKVLRLYARSAPRIAAISRVVALGFKPMPITGNPYNAKIFFPSQAAAPRHSLLFCGRLETIKGPDIFLGALEELNRSYPDLRATIAGAGHLDEKLRHDVRRLGLEDKVHFAGATTPEETADLMRNHEILAVPSIWNEPFGIVALEGIASGCYVVGFADGGLVDALGQAGFLCEKKTASSLAAGIRAIWENPSLREKLDQHRCQHLAMFTPEEITKKLWLSLGLSPQPA